jgi:hypothetical protein
VSEEPQQVEQVSGPDIQALRDLADKWWNPPAELISTLPRGGVALSYLGHADTCGALIEADPAWTWEPMGYDANGQPVVERDDRGNPVGMWAWLTVCGVRRPCYGSCQAGKGDAIKELIGDLCRNGAMRFGVGAGLWSKADRNGDGDAQPKAKPRRKAAASAAPAPAPVADEREVLGAQRFRDLHAKAGEGVTPAQVAEVLRGVGIPDRLALADDLAHTQATAAVMSKWPHQK